MSGEDIKLTQELGFDDILPMPFNKDNITEKLKRVIERETNLDPIEATIRKMETYIGDAKYGEAIRCIDKDLLSPSPFFARIHTTLGKALLGKIKIKESKESLERALKQDSSFVLNDI